MSGPALTARGSGGPVGAVRPIVYVVAVAAATAGLLFGLDVGVISGAQSFLKADFMSQGFPVSDHDLETIVSALLWGATLGAVSSGWLSKALGRKRILNASALVFIAGSLGCALSTSPGILVAMRLFLGLAVGMASFVAPLYLSEVAPQQLRGAMVSMYQLMITIGIVLAFLSDTYFASYANIGGVVGGHWRWMLGILMVPASCMLAAVISLPESPRWLLLKDREQEARWVLERIRSLPEEIEAEIAAIKEDLAVPQNGMELLRHNPNFRRAIYLGISLQVIQQLTGINTVMYYAPRIIEAAGFKGTSDQMWGTVLIGVTNALSTFIAIALVDRWGRKPIMYAGFVTMGAALAAVGRGLDAGMGFVAIGALLIYIVGFAMSAGPIVWILCSEIYPLNGRDLGLTISTATNWIVNAIVGATFLSLLNGLGPGNTFYLYGALELPFIIFFVLYVPETKGVSLEQIAANLLGGKRLRDIGMAHDG